MNDRPRNYDDSAGPNVPIPQRRRRDRLLALLRKTRGCSTASELTERMKKNEEHPYPYGMCCDDLNELERYGLARFYPGVPRLWEAVPVPVTSSGLESDVTDPPGSRLPELVALCPNPSHTEEFYVPHGGRCPAEGCTETLVEYHRAPAAQCDPDIHPRDVHCVRRGSSDAEARS